MEKIPAEIVERAKAAYHKGNCDKKLVLELIFGKEMFKTSKNWDEIKSFELACKEKGIDPAQFVKHLESNGLSNDTIAYEKLKLIISVINGTWVPDYTNSNQPKWWPYFNCKSGFGFQNANAIYVSAGTGLGSRLVLETEKKAIHMGAYFLTEYKSLLM